MSIVSEYLFSLMMISESHRLDSLSNVSLVSGLAFGDVIPMLIS